MLELLLRGGLVVHGSGKPDDSASVGVQGDKIVLLRAAKTSAQALVAEVQALNALCILG